MTKFRLTLLVLILLAACSQVNIQQATVAPTILPTDTSPAVAAATDAPTTSPTSAPSATPSPPAPTETETPESAADPVVTTEAFIFSAHYGGGPAGDWERENWRAFLATQPDLLAESKSTDYYRAFVNQNIHREVTADNPPDVFSASLGGNLREYARQGLIADISDLWTEQGWDEIFPASIKQMASVDGRQYFVPQAIQWNGIFYREDVFSNAGLTPPTTWDELLATCDAFHALGITPFAMTADSNWPPPMGFWFTHINQRLNGPAFHEQVMAGEISFNDPRIRSVFDHWQQLFDHNCFAADATDTGYGGAVDLFESAESAMYAHGEWLFEFIDDATKDLTGFVRFPIINPDVPLGELVPMYGAFMMADTPYPEVAREFLIFVAGEASQASNLAAIKRLPSNGRVDRSELLPLYEDGLRTIEEAETLTPLIGSNTNPSVALALYSAIGRFWANPDSLDIHLARVETARQSVYGDGVIQTPPLAISASDSPVIAHGDSSKRLDPGAVIFHDGLFHMFVNRFDSFPAAVEVGYATSTDGISWTEQGGDPLLTTDSVPFASVSVVASDVLVEQNGTWVLYFHTWQTRSLQLGDGVIGRATAPAPTGPWTVDPDPVLTMADSAESWDGGQVSIADVHVTDDGYIMYYTGASSTGLMQIGLATSPDGIVWTKYDDPTTTEAPFAESDPILNNGARGTWDASAAYTSRVVQTDVGWLMFYKNVGSRAKGPEMGLAFSADGVSWSKSADNPIFGSDVVNDGTAFGLTALVPIDDQIYLFTEHYTGSFTNTDLFLISAEITTDEP